MSPLHKETASNKTLLAVFFMGKAHGKKTICEQKLLPLKPLYALFVKLEDAPAVTPL